MGRTIQIRNVPDHIHREVKARAARHGMTLSEYLLSEFRKILAVPTEEELRERARTLWPAQDD